MSDLKTIRGMPDLYGKDIEDISMIEKTCKEVFLAFNYSEIRTPLIEYKSLFERPSHFLAQNQIKTKIWHFRNCFDNLNYSMKCSTK